LFSYQEADVYLLDDPLSAVDAHVGKAIFNECFVGALARRTRVLVTHQLQYLNAVDKIVVMKAGQISEIGTYDELMAAKGELAQLVNTHVKEAHDSAEAKKNAPADEKTAAANGTVRSFLFLFSFS
jgi:ABC-type transport system involved in cytochrome bd biosynthesis fused ATPase/permease subunit